MFFKIIIFLCLDRIAKEKIWVQNHFSMVDIHFCYFFYLVTNWPNKLSPYELWGTKWILIHKETSRAYKMGIYIHTNISNMEMVRVELPTRRLRGGSSNHEAPTWFSTFAIDARETILFFTLSNDTQHKQKKMGWKESYFAGNQTKED